jgi:hypothetical protein
LRCGLQKTEFISNKNLIPNEVTQTGTVKKKCGEGVTNQGFNQLTLWVLIRRAAQPLN